MNGTIFEFILLLVSHAIAGIFASTPKYSKKVTGIIWGTWVLLQTMLLFYSEFVLTNQMLQFFVGFILSLVGQYVIFFITTKGKLTQRIFTISTYSVFFCIEMSFFAAIKDTYQSIHPVFWLVLQMIMLSAMLHYYIAYVCPLCQSASKNITRGWRHLIITNVVFLLVITLTSIFPGRLESFYDPAFVTFVLLCVAIMAVYPVIFLSINSMSEAAAKREVEAQNKLLLSQIEAENAQFAAEAQARHDRRHHNLVLLEFANNNDIENVRKYLSNLVESEAEIWGDERYCENMTVNTVLNVYTRRAKENGILAEISARVSSDVPILPQDLVIVIANLFENAIHATQELQEEQKHVKIHIKDSARRLLIKVENPCSKELLFDQSLWGVGIRSVVSTANKYTGMYDFVANDGIFSAKISLNL